MYLNLPYCFYNVLLIQNITQIIRNFDSEYLSKLTYWDFKQLDQKLYDGQFIIRFEIIENKLYWNLDPSLFENSYQTEQEGYTRNLHTFLFRSQIIANNIKKILKKFKIKNTTFLFVMEDGLFKMNSLTEKIKNKQFPPVFTISKDKGLENVFYTVDDYTIGLGINYKMNDYWLGWGQWIRIFMEGINEYPYYSKIRKLMWRGKFSDCLMQDKLRDCKAFPRYKLYTTYQQNPSLFDIQYTTTQESLNTSNKLSFHYNLNFIPQKELMIWQSQLLVDGCTTTFPGVKQKLLQNGVMVKSQSDNMQWFHQDMKDGLHYVEVDRDMADLVEKVQKIVQESQQSERFSQESTQWVYRNLLPCHIDQFIYRQLKEYADTLDLDIQQPSLMEVPDFQQYSPSIQEYIMNHNFYYDYYLEFDVDKHVYNYITSDFNDI